MTAVTRAILGICLAAAFGLACAPLGVSTSSRYRITERFPDRLGQVEILGIEVKSALPEDIVTEAHLERLSGFLAHDLQQSTIGLVANLNAGAEARNMSIVLTVDIERLDVATREDRQNRVPSRLYGTISLRRVASERTLGTASIWVKGSGLDLEANSTPDTVREFAGVIRHIVR